MFEAHKVMTDIIKDIQRLHEEDQLQLEDENEDENIDQPDEYFAETTRR